VEKERADLDDIAVGERLFLFNQPPVDCRRVRWAKVEDVDVVADLFEAGVQTRDGRVIQDQLAVGRAADGQGLGDERRGVELLILARDDERGKVWLLHARLRFGR